MSEEESKYAYKKKSAWKIFTDDQVNKVFDYADEYKHFLNMVKTEREAVQKIREIAEGTQKKIQMN